MDAAVLADPEQPGQSVLEEGSHVPVGTSPRLASDASRVVMRHDGDGRVVGDRGPDAHDTPGAAAGVAQSRPKLPVPGCNARFGQGHHVRHWAQGGPTTLSNLALLCRRHHHAVHEEGYQVERGPDGTFQFRRPDGRYPRSHRRLRCPPIRWLHSGHGTSRRGVLHPLATRAVR
ncbi:MAG: HNH endonuclease signature motif containing protein [Candidatus Rokuibacteriota bacterium]